MIIVIYCSLCKFLNAHVFGVHVAIDKRQNLDGDGA
jgi:hypothetical protein